jgi:hypothetical protein
MISGRHVATFFHPQIYKTMNPKSATLARLRSFSRQRVEEDGEGGREKLTLGFTSHINFQTETSKLKLQTIHKFLFTSCTVMFTVANKLKQQKLKTIRMLLPSHACIIF